MPLREAEYAIFGRFFTSRGEAYVKALIRAPHADDTPRRQKYACTPLQAAEAGAAA